jgi:hypothetical protein
LRLVKNAAVQYFSISGLIDTRRPMYFGGRMF